MGRRTEREGRARVRLLSFLYYKYRNKLRPFHRYIRVLGMEKERERERRNIEQTQ